MLRARRLFRAGVNAARAGCVSEGWSMGAQVVGATLAGMLLGVAREHSWSYAGCDWQAFVKEGLI